MAVKKTVTLEAKTKGFDEAEKQIEDVAKAARVANDSVEGLNKTFEQVYGEIQPLTTRMGEAEDRLYELAAAGDTASREYQELLTKVGDYRKVQIQTDLAVDAAATTMGQKLGGAIQGATSGFAAVQGVMGLVGVESEALEKTLLKVQSALAIQQGVQGIRESLPALKQMGMAAKGAFAAMTSGAKAFALTGIGVVLTAIAAVSYALNVMEEEEKKLEEQRQKHHDNELARQQEQIQKRRDAIAEVNKQLDNEQAAREQKVALLQAQGKSISEAEWEVASGAMDTINAKGKALQEEYLKIGKEQVKMYANLRRQFNDTFNTDKDYKAKEAAAYKLADAQKAANKKERAELLKQINALQELKEGQYDKMEVLEAQHLRRQQDKYKAYQDERLKAERLIIDLNLATQEEGERKDVLISEERFRRQIEDLKKTKFTEKEKARLKNLYLTQQFQEEAKIRNRYRQERLKKEKDLINELKKFTEELRQKQLDKEKEALDTLAVIQSDYFQRVSTERLGEYEVEIAQTNAKYDALKKLAEENGQDIFYIEKERKAALLALEKSHNDKIKEDKKRLHDGVVEAASATFETLGNLAELFAGESEEEQKKAFKIQKAANIAQATIDTYASAVSSYNSLAGIPVVGPVLGGAAAAAAVTAGLLNIKSISQQEFGGGVGDTPAVPSDVGGGGAPQFNVVGDSGVNQLAQLQQQPTQAYVVSGEVTTAQALDRNRVQNATL